MLRKICNQIRGFFGSYTDEIKYTVKLSDITIPRNYKAHPPGRLKMTRKRAFYRNTGEFESEIILHKNFELLDGYTSYILAKENGLTKVPVYFTD